MKKIILAMLTLILCSNVTGCSNKNEDKENKETLTYTAEDIFHKMTSHDAFGRFVKDYEVITEESKNDVLVGKSNQYTSKVNWSVNKLNNNFERKFNGGSIEVFKNAKDANRRYNYLIFCTEKTKETFPSDVYGRYTSTLWASNMYVHQKGNIIMSIWQKIDQGFANRYFMDLDSDMQDYEFPQVDSPIESTTQTLLDNEKIAFTNTLLETKNTFDSKLFKEIEEISNEINTLSTILETDIYKKINIENRIVVLKKKIEENYNAGFFNDYYNNWINQLDLSLANYAFPNQIILKSNYYKADTDFPAGQYDIYRYYGNGKVYISYLGEYRGTISIGENYCETKSDECLLVRDVTLYGRKDLEIYDNIEVKLVPK